MEIPVPDGDFPVRKRYPDELRPAQIEVAKLLYGTYGVERADIEGRNRVNRRNVTAFDAPVMGFVFVHEDMLPWSAMDAGLMLQTLFLSAKSRGIDSCPVGILATWRAPSMRSSRSPKDTSSSPASPSLRRSGRTDQFDAGASPVDPAPRRQVTLRAIHR